MTATTISPYPGTVNKSITNNMLEIPQGDRVMVEYVWIDGTGEAMRSKCKTLEFVPKEAKGKLKVDWTFELLLDPLLTISPNLFF